MKNNKADPLVAQSMLHPKPNGTVFRSMDSYTQIRVSVQGVKSLGGHFACLCRGFVFYEVKKFFVIIFRKENGNTFTLFIIFIVKSLQKEQNSTNLLLKPPICRNKSAITPK